MRLIAIFAPSLLIACLMKDSQSKRAGRPVVLWKKYVTFSRLTKRGCIRMEDQSSVLRIESWSLSNVTIRHVVQFSVLTKFGIVIHKLKTAKAFWISWYLRYRNCSRPH